MSETEQKSSNTWIWVVLGAILICLCLLACVCLIGASVLLPVTRSVSTSTPVIVPDTPMPVPSNTSTPALTSTPVSGNPGPVQGSNFAGLWQYPDRLVWIKITSDGRAFQCRIAQDGTVFRSEGSLVEGDKITWEQIWGTDTIQRKADSIILNGKYGEFQYDRTDNEMDTDCDAPF